MKPILDGIRLVLIDLDGTLVDTVPDLALATDKMMQDLGRKPYGEEKIRQWIGNGAPRLVKRALTNTMNGEPDEALYARAYPIFEHYYSKHVCDRSVLYPGVLEGLNGLEKKGFRLGCVTNKPEQYTLPLLQKLEIKHYFEIILSGDSL
ncbi:MAG: HAD family hydrolase, partial [Gammaproteobacteria bacterium]